MIQEDDNLLLVGKAEDEFSSVEVHGKWNYSSVLFCV